MAMIDNVLYEFKGQLRLEDIYHMTYKELGYLRERRRARMSEKNVAENEAIKEILDQ